MKTIRYILTAISPLILAGCADGNLSGGSEPGEQGAPISILGTISQEYLTRADDGGFAHGDAIGVYVVDYSNSAPGSLAPSGNHADNVKFTYSESDGSWSGASKLYWTDGTTPVDAYGYYPFTERVSNVDAHEFSVAERQDKSVTDGGMSGYEASDFLWAKAEGVEPGKVISLMHTHIMASVQVNLLEGEGFDAGEWQTLDKSVLVSSTVVNSTVNLSSGKVSVVEDGKRGVITPYGSGDSFRAIVVPQTVEANQPLLSITVNGDGYRFTRTDAMTYSPGKLHKFAIKVDKIVSGDYVFTLVSEAITPWENDEVSHNGAMKVYTVINCPEPGGLRQAVTDAGINPAKIENLKLTGTMNMEDFNCFKETFGSINSLNIKELRTVGIPIVRDYGIAGWGINEDGGEIDREALFDDALPFEMLSEYYGGGDIPRKFPRLQHIVLPDACRYIGQNALAMVPLVGTLTIPEGVIWIGPGCVGTYGSELHHISNLILPSTVEFIGDWAFNGCEFTNEFLLPDGVKYVGECAFRGCRNSFGQARIPSGIKQLGDNAFSEMPLTGIAVFPAGMKRIPSAFSGTSITGIYIPEGAEEIAPGAFRCELRGDVHLPNSIKRIGAEAFAKSKISHINFPTSLEVIPVNMLEGCEYLMDSLVIPSNIRRINEGAFLGCKNLSSIHIPASVEIIGGNDNGNPAGLSTFSGCNSLEELRCDAVVPPTLLGDPFSGLNEQLNKDNFTLVVPEESTEAYQNAEYWKEFKRISAYRNFVFRPQSAKVLNRGGERKVVLNADAGKVWRVTDCPDWLHISAESGTGKSELTITIDALATGSANRTGEIKVALDGTGAITSFKVRQFNYQYGEDESYTLQTHSAGAVGVPLVIIGDGYDAEDIAEEIYLNDMKKAAEMFFDMEPFKSYKEYFDVYTAFAMSNESGIGSVNYLRDSKFSTSYGNGNHDSRISCAADAAATYSLDYTPVGEERYSRMTVILVANGEAYDGVTTMFDNGTAVAICPKSTSAYPNDWRGLIQHEGGGHAFSKLADEYIYHKAFIQTCRCTCCEHAEGLLEMQAKGWGMNLSLSGRSIDLPWKHLLRDSRVSDIVDVWEGGYFHARGVYRSEYNSVMNNNVPYMSTWCRELTVRRIMEYAGERFDYEAFLAKDSREMGRDFTLGARATAGMPAAGAPLRGAAPIIVKGAPQREFKGVRKAKTVKHNH